MMKTARESELQHIYIEDRSLIVPIDMEKIGTSTWNLCRGELFRMSTEMPVNVAYLSTCFAYTCVLCGCGWTITD